MMKARLIAAALGAALFAFADKAPAGLIIFTGVIDEVRFSGNAAPFTVGDPFSATFFFAGQPDSSECNNRAIRSFQVSLGDFSITAFGGGRAVGGLALCLDVSESNLLYQVFHAIAREVPAPYGFSDTNIVIYDPAVGGVIPPFDQLRENYFNVDLASGGSESDFATGHLTSFPVVRRTPGNSVPESGSPLVSFGLALLGLALVQRKKVQKVRTSLKEMSSKDW
ncbi:MAG: hypothetical protein DME40_16235 [Verrucomicrobia bacterium]|nr:MAG: hypothetical protein DME40_16235 [Verrucomicrobiota bacterium]